MSHELKHVFATLPKMERGVAKVIGGDPKGKKFLYTNGKCVIIRDIENPAIADIYTEHAHEAIVAKYCPSGFYIASGDVSGKVRIWDTTQTTHLLKYEYTPFAGMIKDIAWTGDNNRMAVVGEGREQFGAVFLWDSGSSVGEISGHSKLINSVDIRQNRPYRIATGSDDMAVGYFEGPPFKFKFTNKEHTKFVNCVRFAPDGSKFVSASADGQIFIFDGTTGERVGSLGGEKAHNGGIYAVSWSPDSTQLISASGDKTVKLWDVGVGTAVTTFNMGDDVADQQLGCLWQKDTLLSISLSGYINYLDKNNPDRPLRTIKGHSKSIRCVTFHKAGGQSYIFSGSHDGHINFWDADSGDNDCFAGKGHTNQVSQMVINEEDNELVTCSMDDTLRYISIDKKDYGTCVVANMDFQPKSVSVAPGGLTLAICGEQVVLLKNKKKVFTLDKLESNPEFGTLHPNGSTAAVGCDKKVFLYRVEGNTLVEFKALDVKGIVTGLAYSYDGAYLAVIDSMKVTTLFSVVDDYSVKDQSFVHHAKPVCLAWSPDSQRLATGGIDMLVVVWTIADSKKIRMNEPHRMHHVVDLAWKDERTLITVAHDASVKQWTIQD